MSALSFIVVAIGGMDFVVPTFPREYAWDWKKLYVK